MEKIILKDVMLNGYVCFFVYPQNAGCLGGGLEVTNERLGLGAGLELLSDFLGGAVCLEKKTLANFFFVPKKRAGFFQDFLGRNGLGCMVVRMPMPAVDPDSNAPEGNLPMDASWAATWGVRFCIHRICHQVGYNKGYPEGYFRNQKFENYEMTVCITTRVLSL